jgi:hypothetical protein
MKLHSSIDREFLDEKIAQYNFKKMKADFKGLYTTWIASASALPHVRSMEHIQIQTTVEGMLFKLFGPGMLIEKLDLAIVRGACGLYLTAVCQSFCRSYRSKDHWFQTSHDRPVSRTTLWEGVAQIWTVSMNFTLKPDSDVFQAVTDSLDSLIDRSPPARPHWTENEDSYGSSVHIMANITNAISKELKRRQERLEDMACETRTWRHQRKRFTPPDSK